MKKLLLFTVICLPIFYVQAIPFFNHSNEEEYIDEESINENLQFVVSGGYGFGGSSNSSNSSFPFGIEAELLVPKAPVGISAGFGVVGGVNHIFSAGEVTRMGAINIHLKKDDIHSPFVSVQYTDRPYTERQETTTTTPSTKEPDSGSTDGSSATPTATTTTTSSTLNSRIAITINARQNGFQFGIGISEPLNSKNRIQDAGLVLNAGFCF